MNINPKYTTTKSSKKTYKTPKVTLLGSVKKLTLKAGSDVDTYGGTFILPI